VAKKSCGSQERGIIAKCSIITERRVIAPLAPFLAAHADGDAALPFECTLDETASHHIRTVLRLVPGAILTVIDPDLHRRFVGTITTVLPRVTVRLERELPQSLIRSRARTLAFALCKGDKNDFVCQKGCELGVERIVLWQAERSIVRIDTPRDGDKKLDRWRKIVASAAEQSGRSDVPEVLLALDSRALLSIIDGVSTGEDIRLFCSLDPDAAELRHTPPPSGGAHIVIGPEGDFTPTESAALRAANFHPLSLAPLILRAETAAIAAVASINGAWGFSKPPPS
jgi:16S rRNA (uracil1498-N3)-methyltransferase